MDSTTHRGVTIAYRDEGRGVPVVLLMGLGLPGAVWSHRLDDLVESGYRVMIPDACGTGHSDVPWPPYTMSTLAEDVVRVMNEASMESALVAGVSFGGMVAQHVALDHSERVEGLLLISTTPGLPAGTWPGSRAIWLLLKSTLRPEATTVEEGMELLAHPNSEERFLTFQRKVDEVLTEDPTPASGVLGQLSAVVAHNTGSRLSEIQVPTRVVTGDSDILVPPSNSDVLADRIPNATLRVLRDAGHVAIHSHPDCLLEELEGLRHA